MTDTYSYAALKGLGEPNYSSAALRGLGEPNYTSAALRGLGEPNYTSAALRGLGEPNYTSAALRGLGKPNYTSAALRGLGISMNTRLRKGSPEAKARMAYLRSLRGKKVKRGKLVGGGPVGTIIGKSLGFWKNYFTDWHTAGKSEKQLIAELKQKIDKLRRERGMEPIYGVKF